MIGPYLKAIFSKGTILITKRAFLASVTILMVSMPSVAYASGDPIVLYSMGIAVLAHLVGLYLFSRVKSHPARWIALPLFLVAIGVAWYLIWNDRYLSAWSMAIALILGPFVPSSVVVALLGRKPK